MKKLFMFVLPYILIGIAFFVHEVYIDFEYTIIAPLFALFACIMILMTTSCAGTKGMIVACLINFVISIAFFILMSIGYMNDYSYLIPTLSFVAVTEVIMVWYLLLHKPAKGMTYQFSYKNQPKRYF